MSVKPIQFTPTSQEQRDDIEAYARAKGHKNGSAFALYACVQMMMKYPLSVAQKAKVGRNVEEGEEDR